MEEIIVRFVELPSTVNGVTVVDENGDYNVYINVRLTDTAARETYRHETRHIKRNHFFDLDTVINNELDAKKN